MAQQILHPQNYSFSQTPPSLSKQSNDNETQLTQSTGHRRLVRKSCEKSSPKRSNSRKSSEKSCESLVVSKFYTKMGASQLTNDSLTSLIRSDMINRRDCQKSRKKREPTPAPGYISRKTSIQKVFTKEIQTDLLIAEWQKKLKDQIQKNRFQESRAQTNEKQLKIKTNKILELQKRLLASLQKENVLQSKLKAFEELAIKSESRLSQTKSALEKLKKNIQQTRYAQMEAQNSKFRKQNQHLKDLNQQLSQQVKTLSIKCIDLEGQIYTLKNQRMKQPQNSKESIEQPSKIEVKSEYTVKLQNTISKLQIKLNYLNRKKNEELQNLKLKKNEQLAKARHRLSYVNQELNAFKKQNQKLKKGVSLPERTTLMNCIEWPKHDQIFCLSLSP